MVILNLKHECRDCLIRACCYEICPRIIEMISPALIKFVASDRYSIHNHLKTFKDCIVCGHHECYQITFVSKDIYTYVCKACKTGLLIRADINMSVEVILPGTHNLLNPNLKYKPGITETTFAEASNWFKSLHIIPVNVKNIVNSNCKEKQ